MATRDNPYSRFVGWVKILLPLTALGLLSTLFLVARGPDRESLPFADVELEELARGRGITQAHITGLTAEGHELSVMAGRATPRIGARDLVDAEEIRADLVMRDGRRLWLRADSGVIDNSQSHADLKGDVVIETATGHRIETEILRTAFDRTEMESGGPAHVTGPQFVADAGKLVVEPDPDDSDAVIVVFKQGVLLIYTPQPE